MSVYYQSKIKKELKMRVMHTQAAIGLICSTLIVHGTQLFIELGTYKGGLALALSEYFDFRLRIITIDCRQQFPDALLHYMHNVQFIRMDLLKRKNEQYDYKILSDLLKQKKNIRKVLYCDNGNKIEEINTYAKYLNQGDLLGTDDYLSRKPGKKVSDTTVTNPVQIEHTLKEYNFQPFFLDLWEKSGEKSRFWIKEK